MDSEILLYWVETRYKNAHTAVCQQFPLEIEWHARTIDRRLSITLITLLAAWLWEAERNVTYVFSKSLLLYQYWSLTRNVYFTRTYTCIDAPWRIWTSTGKRLIVKRMCLWACKYSSMNLEILLSADRCALIYRSLARFAHFIFRRGYREQRAASLNVMQKCYRCEARRSAITWSRFRNLRLCSKIFFNFLFDLRRRK